MTTALTANMETDKMWLGSLLRHFGRQNVSGVRHIVNGSCAVVGVARTTPTKSYKREVNRAIFVRVKSISVPIALEAAKTSENG